MVKRARPSWPIPDFDHDQNFDVTEDLTIDEYSSGKSQLLTDLTPAEVRLLHSPLPADLPTVNKDLLILMAAYEGNIDRYARLRRPHHMIVGEACCIMRGIYHHTTFAKWWDRELLLPEVQKRVRSEGSSFKQAINARYIMCNELSRITESRHIPYVIWYPLIPEDDTLKEIVRRKPEMKKQAAQACIFADYQHLYDELNPEPDYVLCSEAENSSNKHYMEDLERRGAELGIGVKESTSHWYQNGSFERHKEPGFSWLYGYVNAGQLQPDDNRDGVYDALQTSSRFVDPFICGYGGDEGGGC